MESPNIIETILDILKVVAALVAIIGSTAWIWEYRLKVKAERRLAEASEIESQIKLLKLFTEIMTIAHARGGYEVSDKAIEKIITPELLQSSPPGSEDLNSILTNTLIRIPVGAASQDAAIAAIWKLGKEHAILKEASLQALESISEFKPKIATPFLQDLESNEK